MSHPETKSDPPQTGVPADNADATSAIVPGPLTGLSLDDSRQDAAVASLSEETDSSPPASDATPPGAPEVSKGIPEDSEEPVTPQTPRPPALQIDSSSGIYSNLVDTPRMSTMELISAPENVVPEESTAAVMEGLRQRLNDAVTVTNPDESGPFANEYSASSTEIVAQNPFADPDTISEIASIQTDSQLSRASSMVSGMQTPVPPALHTVHIPRNLTRTQSTPVPLAMVAPPIQRAQTASFNVPSHYFIRGKRVDPVLLISHMKYHLSLMNAFWLLRQTVENLDDPPVSPFPADKEKRWTWFVGFAVERFSAWCESLNYEDKQRSVSELTPPLDVLMVWHSYLLNPGWYAEDCARVPNLKILGEIGHLVFGPTLLHALVTIIHDPVTDLRREVWNLKTQGRPFDVFDDARQNQLKLIWCPDCQDPVLHPFMNEEGTGYLQQKFKAICSNKFCFFHERPFFKSTLGARKLAEDLIRPDADPERSRLAGTFWSARWGLRGPRADRIKEKILKWEPFRCPDGLADESLLPLILRRHKNDSLHNDRLTGRDEFINEGWALSVLWRHEFNLYKIIDGIHGRLKHCSKLVNHVEILSQRITSAYMDGNMFSIDLVGSVLRQSIFVKKMHKLGWSKIGFTEMEGSHLILHHCLARYHGFLDLCATNTNLIPVPTLDIDLAWHTHQLFGMRYHNICLQVCGRLIDHNDKTEENELSDAFNDTCRAWKSRFEIDYISCGCPIPGKTLNQFWGIGPGASKNANTHSSVIYTGWLVPPPLRDESVMRGTHPSDHDAVYNNRASGVSDKLRSERLEKRAKKLGEKGKGKGSPTLNFKKGKFNEQALESETLHGPAFLAPIPGWYYARDGGDGTWVGYAAGMFDPQPLGETDSIPQELRRFTEPAGLGSSNA